MSRIRAGLLTAFAALALVLVSTSGAQASVPNFTFPTTGYSIWTVAGTLGFPCSVTSPCGIGGPAVGAHITNPYAVAIDSHGDMAITAYGDDTLEFVPAKSGKYFGHKMVAGHDYVIAGKTDKACSSGTCGGGQLASAATLSEPSGVAFNTAGDLFVADDYDQVIRLIPIKSGRYYGKAMKANHIYTIAGSMGKSCTSATCGDGGPATSGRLTDPLGIAVSHAGNILVADDGDAAVRFIPAAKGTYYGHKMSADHIYTVAGIVATRCSSGTCGNGDLATTAPLVYPAGVSFDGAGDVLIADADADLVRFIPVKGGRYYDRTMVANHIYTIAGEALTACSTATCGDGFAGTSATLDLPYGVVANSSGDVFIADFDDDTVREVTRATGNINVVAGTEHFACEAAPCGDGGAATAGYLSQPTSVTLDGSGGLLVADYGEQAIRWLTGP